MLVVEQNARAALGIADRGYVLENGRITPSSGKAADLLTIRPCRKPILAGRAATPRNRNAHPRQAAANSGLV